MRAPNPPPEIADARVAFEAARTRSDGTNGAEPRASVLVAALDDRPSLRDLLQITRPQADGLDAEIVLVLNGPESSLSATRRRELEAVCDRVVYEPRRGKSHALNRGIECSRGEVIAFTDDDTLPRPGWLESILRRLLDPARDADLVAVGGPVVPVFDPDVPEWFRRVALSRPSHYLGPRHEHGDQPRDYPFSDSPLGGVPFGANFAARREVFETLSYPTDLGPSPLTGLRGGEDTVLERWILARGLRILYEPRAMVLHPVLPERATLSFAMAASRAHGRESVIARRHLELPAPGLGRLVKKIWKRRRGLLAPRRATDLDAILQRLRLAELEGTLIEQMRSRARVTPSAAAGVPDGEPA